MKRFNCQLFVMLCILSVSAQRYKLIDVSHCSDASKDCGDCISAKYIKNDTLHLTFFINNVWDLDAYRHSFSFKNDTLSLNLNDTNRIKIIKVYNKSKHKMETREFRQATLYNGKSIERMQWTLIGFTKMPKGFQFNGTQLLDCPTKPIKFDIYKNDTINMLNANGYKQGDWIEFYDTGEILKKKKYNNGQFIEGYYYIKQGKATHRIQEGKLEESILIEETNLMQE